MDGLASNAALRFQPTTQQEPRGERWASLGCHVVQRI